MTQRSPWRQPRASRFLVADQLQPLPRPLAPDGLRRAPRPRARWPLRPPLRLLALSSSVRRRPEMPNSASAACHLGCNRNVPTRTLGSQRNTCRVRAACPPGHGSRRFRHHRDVTLETVSDPGASRSARHERATGCGLRRYAAHRPVPTTQFRGSMSFKVGFIRYPCSSRAPAAYGFAHLVTELDARLGTRLLARDYLGRFPLLDDDALPATSHNG